MLRADEEVNSLPCECGDDYERVVMPLMFWSNATQLANFGDASLWPIYLFFGNQSKYMCGKPSAGACHHITYIPKVCHEFCTGHDAEVPSSYQIISKTLIWKRTIRLQPTK